MALSKHICLLGFMGAGKSTVGESLAQRLNVSWIDSDLWIEQSKQQSIQELISTYGWSVFRDCEKEFPKSINSREPSVISCGGGFPLDKSNWNWISTYCTSIYIEVDVDLLFLRLSDNLASRPLLKDLNQESLKLYIASELKRREPFYKRANFIVNGNGTIKDIISLVEALI